jgi:hypothetical protein
MPWELAIRSRNNELLGSRDEVVQRMSKALPSIKWETEPPMPEEAARYSDEEIKRYFLTSHLSGYFADSGLVIEFYGFEPEPIKSVHAALRGNCNPIPLLAALCVPNGWVVIDLVEKKEIDLSSAGASGWEAFRQFRDEAIRQSREADRKVGE